MALHYVAFIHGRGFGTQVVYLIQMYLDSLLQDCILAVAPFISTLAHPFNGAVGSHANDVIHCISRIMYHADIYNTILVQQPTNAKPCS